MESLDARVLRDIRELSARMNGIGGTGDDEAFWNTLSGKHSMLIERFGFANFKRTVNFEYSQWGVSSFRDPKFRRLAASLLRKSRLPWGGFRPSWAEDPGLVRWPDSIDVRTAASRSHPGFGGRLRLAAHAFYNGLLWQYAATEDSLGVLARVEEPAVGNPLPLYQGGRLISQDLALGALELNRIATRVSLGSVRSVLEIGAGYGRMAWLFRTMFPGVEYTILDVPPALAISRHYLEQVFGGDAVGDYECDATASPPGEPGRIRFLAPAALASVPDGRFDLVLNISSFDEMSPGTVDAYLRALERVGAGWMYLKGYARSRSAGHRLGLLEFPMGARWRELATRRDPVVPGFIERLFEKTHPPA